MKKTVFFLISLIVVTFTQVLSQAPIPSFHKDYIKYTSQQITNGIVQSDSAEYYSRPGVCLFKGIVISNYDELSTADVIMTNLDTKEKHHEYTNDYGEFNFRLIPGKYELHITHAAYNDLYIQEVILSGGEKRIIKMLIHDLPLKK